MIENAAPTDTRLLTQDSFPVDFTVTYTAARGFRFIDGNTEADVTCGRGGLWSFIEAPQRMYM